MRRNELYLLQVDDTSPEATAGSTGSMHVLRAILVNTQRRDITRYGSAEREAITNLLTNFPIYLEAEIQTECRQFEKT